MTVINKKISMMVLLVFLFVACTETSDTLKIGAVLPLSGYGSETGQTSLNGYELAIKEINDQGGLLGKQIELVVADHKGDSTQEALSAYNSLKLKGINVVLGPHFSPLGQAMAPVACDDDIVLISPSIGIRGFVEQCDLIFDVWPADYQNSKLLGEMVVKQGHKRIAIIGSEQSWEYEQAEGVKEGVESAKGNLVEYIITQDKPDDFLTEATKIVGANADAVIFTNYGYMDIVAKRLREQGSKAQFYVVILDEARKNGAQGAFENAIIISSFSPSAEFIKKFEKEYDATIDFAADTSYDSVMLLAQAITATESTDPERIAAYLLSLKEYSGASGHLTFDSNGGVLKNSVFQTVKNNVIVKYYLAIR